MAYDNNRAISLQVPEELLVKGDRCAEALAISRAEYIRRAIEEMNGKTENELRARRLAAASKLVRDESMRVNADFEEIEYDPDA